MSDMPQMPVHVGPHELGQDSVPGGANRALSTGSFVSQTLPVASAHRIRDRLSSRPGCSKCTAKATRSPRSGLQVAAVAGLLADAVGADLEQGGRPADNPTRES